MNFHVKNWFRIGHGISWKLSWYSLMTMLYFVPGFKRDWVYRYVQRKHEFVLRSLKPLYQDLIENYKDNTEELSSEPINKTIWVLWWQGEETAPDLVRSCIASMRKHANGAEVILLTKDNYKSYVDVPDYIQDKLDRERVKLPGFADYLRACLIYKYGGLWLDATMYVSQDIPDKWYEYNFFTLHTKEQKTAFVSNNRLHCYVFGGKKGSSFAKYVKDALERYWFENDILIDYYYLDYSIMLAYYLNSEIRKTMDSLPYTSESLYEMIAAVNEPLDEDLMERLFSENIVSKMNWRVKTKAVDGRGRPTNYSYIRRMSGL